MDGNWFIFKGDHHLGPFSLEKIIAMYQADELSEDILLWKEGGESWRPFKKTPELIEAISKKENERIKDASPMLPPLPAGLSISAMNEKEEILIPLAKGFVSKNEHDPFRSLKGFIGEAENINLNEKDLESDRPPPVSPPSLPNLPGLPSEDIDEDLEKGVQERVQEGAQEGIQEELEEVPEFNLKAERPVKTIIEQGPPELWAIDEIGPEALPSLQNLKNLEFLEDLKGEARPEVSESTDLSKLENHQEKRFKQKEKIVQMTMGILCFTMVLLSLYMFNDTNPSKELFVGLGPQNYKKLTNYVKKAKSGSLEGLEYKWSVDKKNDFIWMAFNRLGPGSLHLSLHSLKEKNLGQKEVVLIGKSKIYKGTALFNKFDLVKGTQLSPGYYQAKLQVFDTGLTHQFYSFLKSLPLFRSLPFVKNLSGLQEIQKEILFFNGSAKEITNQLEKLKKEKRDQLLLPLKYQLESVITLNTLLEKFIDAYKEGQESWKFKKDVLQFYRMYAREISPILQGIIIDHIKKKKKIDSVKKEVIKRHDLVIGLGKSIGALAAEVISKSRKNTKLIKKRQDVLRRRFLTESELIKEEGRGTMNHFKKLLDF